MSFLGDLVNTIGGDRAPAPPLKPITKPIITGVSTINTSKSLPSTPIVGQQPKSVYKGTAGSSGPLHGTSLKRKAEDDTSERVVKAIKSSSAPLSDLNGQKPSRPNGDSQRPSTGVASSTNGSTINAPTKAPAKGGYAAMMARAKEAQQVKVPSQIGMIKHQAVDKVKTSKLAERKKEEQVKGKNTVPAISAPSSQPTRPGQKMKPDPRRRSASPVKKSDTGPKPIRVPRPPLHGPGAAASAPAYKGTMGQTPKKSRQELERRKRSRYDDYLGTDEEEDDDDDGHGYGGGNDFYSDEEDDGSDINDMEGGGIDALWEEERLAEQAGRAEDAREAALEAKLKREKLERKQKLAALAAKRR